jgi:two-component system response regulator DesR
VDLPLLALVAEGKTSKEISAQLSLSSGTVRNYISEILNKVNVKKSN